MLTCVIAEQEHGIAALHHLPIFSIAGGRPQFSSRRSREPRHQAAPADAGFFLWFLRLRLSASGQKPWSTP